MRWVLREYAHFRLDWVSAIYWHKDCAKSSSELNNSGQNVRHSKQWQGRNINISKFINQYQQWVKVNWHREARIKDPVKESHQYQNISIEDFEE